MSKLVSMGLPDTVFDNATFDTDCFDGNYPVGTRITVESPVTVPQVVIDSTINPPLIIESPIILPAAILDSTINPVLVIESAIITPKVTVNSTIDA